MDITLNSNNDGVAKAKTEESSSPPLVAATAEDASLVGVSQTLSSVEATVGSVDTGMGVPVKPAEPEPKGPLVPVFDKTKKVPPKKNPPAKLPAKVEPKASKPGLVFTGKVRIPENATDALAVLTHMGVQFEVLPPSLLNPHQVAAGCRMNARVVVMEMICHAMKRIAKERSDERVSWDKCVVLMYHSTSELNYMKGCFRDSPPEIRWKNNKKVTPLNGPMVLMGWRDASFGTDDVRERPVVYHQHHLTAPILYFGDSLYYFTVEKFIALVGKNVNVKLSSGLLVFVVARHLPDQDGSVLFENFKAPEVTVLAGEETHYHDDGTEYTTTREITVGPTNRLEARAFVKDGRITFYASGPGDSVYRHPVENWFYTHSVLCVEYDGRFYSISLHVDRSSGPYGIIRALVKETPELGVSVMVQPLKPTSWVADGYRLTKLQSLSHLTAARIEPTSEVSVQSAIASVMRRTFATFGVEQSAHLQDFHEILSECVKRQIEVSFAETRTMMNLELAPLGGARETGIKFMSGRIQEETGLGPAASTHLARMTKQQTRFEFLLSVVHAVRDLGDTCATWVWEQLSRLASWFRKTVSGAGKKDGDDASLSGLVHIYRFCVSLLRRFRRTAALLDRVHGKLSGLRVTEAFTKWAHQHPIVAAVLEEALLFAGCFLTAVVEEVGKKIIGPGWTVLFAAGEAIIAALADVFDGKDLGLVILGKQVIKREVVHILKHIILWAAPLWLSIPMHTLSNYLEHSKMWRQSFKGFVHEVDEAVRQVPGQEIEMQVLNHSLPPNLVDEVTNIYHREADGQLTPLREVFDSFESPLLPMPSNTYHRVILADETNLIKPKNDLLNLIVVAVRRLELEPNFEPAKGCWKQTVTKYLEQVSDLDSPSVVVMTLEEGVRYIEDRPWTQGHKKMRIAELLLCAGLPEDYKGSLAKIKCFVKIDETLKCNSELSEEMPACKSRPVMPLPTCGVPDILWIKPMKEYMAVPDNWELVDGAARLLSPEDEGGSFIFMYVIEVRPDLLGQLVTDLLFVRHKMVVWLAHGDDSLIIAWVKGVLAAFAADLATCDITCGPQVQRGFVSYAQFATSGSVETELKRWLERKTGTIHLQCPEAAELGLDLVMEQERLQTLTGEQATSLLAVFPQKMLCPQILEACCRHGEFEIELLPKTLVSVMNHHGLDPVSDYGIKWTPLEATPFLGGCFVHQEERIIFYSLSFSKLLLGPCRANLSSDEKRLAWLKDLSVASEERALHATPPGRALVDLYDRILKNRGFDSSMRKNAKEEYLNQLKVSNPWKYERLVEVGDYEVPKVSSETYIRSMSSIAELLGNPDPTSEIIKFIEVCRNVDPASCNGSIKLDATANFAFAARFSVRTESCPEGHGA